MTIGRWPEWNTTAARERAKELRRDIDEGIDPLACGKRRARPRGSTT
jgi:plasmid stabilization system protein ParE